MGTKLPPQSPDQLWREFQDTILELHVLIVTRYQDDGIPFSLVQWMVDLFTDTENRRSPPNAADLDEIGIGIFECMFRYHDEIHGTRAWTLIGRALLLASRLRSALARTAILAIH